LIRFTALTNLDGFSNLSTVGDSSTVNFVRDIFSVGVNIELNDNLMSISGLAGLDYVESLFITNNNLLNDLEGIQYIGQIKTNLWIHTNGFWSSPPIQGIVDCSLLCPFINSDNPPFISTIQKGCTGVEEAATYCTPITPPDNGADFLVDFPWLVNYVDFDNCNGEKITVYNSRGYPYVYIESASSSILYNGSGQTYCTSSLGYNCLDFYKQDELIATWTCLGF